MRKRLRDLAAEDDGLANRRLECCCVEKVGR